MRRKRIPIINPPKQLRHFAKFNPQRKSTNTHPSYSEEKRRAYIDKVGSGRRDLDQALDSANEGTIQTPFSLRE